MNAPIENQAQNQLDPNRSAVPNPSFQTPVTEKVENEPSQGLPQITAANTAYYYDVNASAGAPRKFQAKLKIAVGALNLTLIFSYICSAS